MIAMLPKNKSVSRRSFLSLLGKCSLAVSAFIGLGVLWRYFGFQSEIRASRQFDLGLASAYPLGSRTPVPAAQAIIIHNSQGFSSLSLVCPHLGCEVYVISDGFSCPCHGSRYLQDGSLRNGPASRPLANLRVEVNPEGHLILYNG